MKFRDLTANDIEVRVQSAKANGVILLLYKNARVDMNILDEVVGPEYWQREHYECKGNLFCRVGIKCDNEWIWKSDCGIESNTDAEKGEASDSFKRACFNWGIGRELYTSPFIWVPADKCNIIESTVNNKKVYRCSDKFSVKTITIKDKRIESLSILNEKKNEICFVYGEMVEKPKAKTKATPKQEKKALSPIQEQVNGLCKELASLEGSTAGKVFEKGMSVLKLPDKSDGQLLLMINWLKGEIEKANGPLDELEELIEQTQIGA